MAKLTTITNPFDPINSREVSEIAHGKPLYATISGFYCYFDLAVSVNGVITKDYEYIVKEEDHVAFIAIPDGGGDGKNPWALVATIALMVVAPYVGAFAGVLMGTVVAYNAAYAATMILGGMLINSLLPPNMPDQGGSPLGGLQSSPTYSWSPSYNPVSEGSSIPIVYGKTIITPLVISQYVETVNTKQYLNILYALNDGEIASVTDIMINGNPLSYYDAVTYDTRLGTNNQTLIPSFDNIRVDTGVNVKLGTSGTVRSTQNNNVEALTIVVVAPNGLFHMGNDGGIGAISVPLSVGYRLVGSGTWTFISSTSISGASTSSLRATFNVNNLTPGQYEITVSRSSIESTSIRTKDTVFFEAFTEIIYDDFTYPNTALLSIRALATDQLSGQQPRVTCVVDRGHGLDNPALAAKNIIQLIGGDVNAAKFTDWADWCVAQNLKCNVVFDAEINVREALNVVSLLGRANVIPIGSEYVPIIDKVESLAVQRFLFTMGNIVKDSFEEDYLPLADRTNVVELTYFDETLDYTRHSIEVYQNGFDESIDSTRKASITLYGCTSRAQAIRHARYMLNKNRYLTNTISFEADVDAIACTIGDVIDVAHDVPQWGYSGRMFNYTAATPSTEWVFELGVFVDGVFIDPTTFTTFVKLDRQVTMSAGVDYYLTVKYNSDDSRETLQISSPTTITTDIFPFELNLSKPVEDYMLYSFGTVNRESKQFRVSSITRASDQKRKITCIEYIPEVYDDESDHINVVSVSDLSSVSSLMASTYYRTDIKGISVNVVDITWIGTGIGWSVYSRLVGTTEWIFEGYTTKPNYQIVGVKAGSYEYRVGDKTTTSIAEALPLAPSISNVVVSPRYTGVQFDISFTMFDGYSHIEIYEGTLLQTFLDATLIATSKDSVYQRYGMEIVDSKRFWFRLVDEYGNFGLTYGPVVGSTTTDVSAILLDLKAQQGTPQYLPALSDILIAGYVAGVPSLGLSGNLFVDGTVTADKLAVMGLSTFTNDTGYTTTKTYAQATAPSVSMTTGDIWYDTDDNNKTYRYNGASWVSIELDAALAVNNNTTTILGSKITTGTITAAHISVSNLSAISADLGSITAGKISTNGLRAFNSKYPLNTSTFFLNTGATSANGQSTVLLYSASYSSGFLATRTLLTSQTLTISYSVNLLIPANVPSGWKCRLYVSTVGNIDSPVLANTVLSYSGTYTTTYNGETISPTIYVQMVTNTGSAVSSGTNSSAITINTINLN